MQKKNVQILNNVGKVELSVSKIGDNVNKRFNTRSQSDILNLVEKKKFFGHT